MGGDTPDSSTATMYDLPIRIVFLFLPETQILWLDIFVFFLLKIREGKKPVLLGGPPLLCLPSRLLLSPLFVADRLPPIAPVLPPFLQPPSSQSSLQ
jgi:hypothetical protein